MTEDELQKWAESQVDALVAAGIDRLDAQQTMKQVLAQLPEGVDPRTWIPPADGGPVEITEADVEDARADWMASDAVEPKYKRLLDAEAVEDDSDD